MELGSGFFQRVVLAILTAASFTGCQNHTAVAAPPPPPICCEVRGDQGWQSGRRMAPVDTSVRRTPGPAHPTGRTEGTTRRREYGT